MKQGKLNKYAFILRAVPKIHHLTSLPLPAPARSGSGGRAGSDGER